LTWSHATFVTTILEYMNKVGEVDISKLREPNGEARAGR
jgi:hypothetical protein